MSSVQNERSSISLQQITKYIAPVLLVGISGFVAFKTYRKSSLKHTEKAVKVIIEVNGRIKIGTRFDKIKNGTIAFANKRYSEFFVDDFWAKNENIKNFITFNKKALEYEAMVEENDKINKSSNNNESDANIYIGSTELISIDSRPYLIAQINDSTLHKLQFKKYMNEYYEKYNDEIKYDIIDYTQINGGKINYLLSPNKNLSCIMDENVILQNNIKLHKEYTKNLSKITHFNFHCWIPTIISINKSQKVTICGDIHNLNKYKYGRLHNYFIPKLFEEMLPSFSNIMQTQLMGIKLKCIIQIKDYELNTKDTFEGGVHKDGLFESIKAIGIYYYHIDNNLIGGNLQLHSLIESDDGQEIHGTKMQQFVIPIKENRFIVFNNYATYHKVTKLRLNNNKNEKSGHRKCILFFILDTKKTNNYLDTMSIKTNLQYHMIQLVMIWCNIKYVQEYKEFKETYYYNAGYKWLFDLITYYLIGDNGFIQQTTELFRRSRKVYRYNKFRNNINSMIKRGYTPIPPTHTQRFRFHQADW